MMRQAEMLELVKPLLQSEGVVYKKYKHVFAKKAKEGETILTITNDGLETVNTASNGDYIVKNQTDAEELYILTQKKFNDRYTYLKSSNDGFSEYFPKGKIIGLELTSDLLQKHNLPKEFHFEAAWGTAMIAKENDFLASPPDLSEVYRIARKEFFETYKVDGGR